MFCHRTGDRAGAGVLSNISALRNLPIDFSSLIAFFAVDVNQLAVNRAAVLIGQR